MNHIRPLTGLRGLAALWVVLIHIEALHSPHLPQIAQTLLSSFGILPVVFFFALSGFILSFVYLPRVGDQGFTPASTREYAWARVARILPLYVCSILPAIVIHGIWAFTLNNQMPFTAETRTGAPLFNQDGWAFNALLRSNVPAWTLSAELIFYILFPSILGAIAQKPSKQLVRGLVGWLGAYLGLQLIFGVMQMSGDSTLAALGYGLGQFASPIFIPIFVAGVILGILHLRCELPVWPKERSTWLYVGVFTVTAWMVNPREGGLPASLISALLAPLFLLAIMAGSTEEGVLNRFFCTTPLEFLGRASYAIYITHWPIKQIVEPFLMTTPLAGQPLVVGLLVLLASFLGGIAAHLWIETPAYAWVSTTVRNRALSRA